MYLLTRMGALVRRNFYDKSMRIHSDLCSYLANPFIYYCSTGMYIQTRWWVGHQAPLSGESSGILLADIGKFFYVSELLLAESPVLS